MTTDHCKICQTVIVIVTIICQFVVSLFPAQPRQQAAQQTTIDVSEYTGWITKLYATARQKSHLFHGAELSAAASVRLQSEGARIVVLADLRDVSLYLTRTQGPSDGDDAHWFNGS